MPQNPSLNDAKLRRAVRARALTQRAWEALYKRFKQLEGQGLSQADLARSLGKAPAQVSRVLGGPTNMTFETFAEYADALGTYAVVELREPAVANTATSAPHIVPLQGRPATSTRPSTMHLPLGNRTEVEVSA